jgi:hypothetical protein
MWFRGDNLPMPGRPGAGPVQTLFGALDGEGCEDIYLAFGSGFSAPDELTFVVDRDGDCGAAADLAPARTAGFASGTWYHVAAVADYPMNQTRLYVNGDLRDTRSKTEPPIQRNLLINVGRWSDGPNTTKAYFDGGIDELRVYSRPLLPSEILDHYALGAGTYGVPGEDGIEAGWHFDESSGTAAYAYVGPANGVLNGDATWGLGWVIKP